MKELTLNSVSYGWEKSDTPDAIEYVVQTGDSNKNELMASLQQLAILYDGIVTEEKRSFYMGTGTPVEVATTNGETMITFGDIRTSEPTERTLEKVKGLLEDVFVELDKRSPSTARESQLKQINRHLREHYGGTDFKALYDEVM